MQYVGIHIGKQDLAERVKTLRDSIFALGEKEKFNESSTFLYQQLIQPILPHATGKELIIVPHDVLHYLPFHALMGPDGRYLIEKYPVYYLSSASLLQFVQEKRKAGGDKVLAFGNPDLGDPEKNLEYAELEAEEVKNVYPESAVYVKKEASEEKSKSLSPSMTSFTSPPMHNSMRTIRFHRLCFWPREARRTGDWRCERFSGWISRPI